MRNTAHVTCGKPIVVWLQSITGADTINSLVAFNDIHGIKREVLFFCSVPNTTRDVLTEILKIKSSQQYIIYQYQFYLYRIWIQINSTFLERANSQSLDNSWDQRLNMERDNTKYQNQCVRKILRSWHTGKMTYRASYDPPKLKKARYVSNLSQIVWQVY
jgi:hypothetical protein